MSPDVAPLVRGRHLQEWLEAVGREPDPFRARFFAGLPAAMKSDILGTSGVTWLPVRYHVELADLMREHFGVARAHDYYRRQFAASMRGPVLGPLVRTGMALLGVTPASLIRWADKGWQSSFRGCGTMQGEMLGPGRGRLVYAGLPAVCTSSDAWLESSQGSAYGVYDLMRVDGIVRIDTSGRGEGRLVIDLEWTTRK
jgi:hypothetical protein